MPSTLATCTWNSGGVVVVFSMWSTRIRFGCWASYGDHDGFMKIPTETIEARARKTMSRAVKEAPQRWQKGKNCMTSRSAWTRPRLCVRVWTHHGESHETKNSDENGDDEVDWGIRAHTTGQRHEEIEEADHAFDADQQGQRLVEVESVS